MAPVITCIDDLKTSGPAPGAAHVLRLRRFRFLDRSTYRANEDDFARIKFRQRVAVNMENRSIASTMVGEKVAMPVAIAPTGLTGMQHADGEILAARAAERFGIPFTLSTMSICSIEDIAAATTRPFWFQLYVMKDRDFINRLIDRAKAANCSALVITLDLQILGQRHKDLKNGLSAPPKPTLSTLLNLATKPRWCLRHAGHAAPDLRQHRRPRQERERHVVAERLDGAAVRSGAELGRRRMDQEALGRQDHPQGHPRCRRTPGSRCETGADALIVSNHGGRQLDGAPRRSRRCRPSSMRSAARSKSISTAASAPGRTW